MPQPYSDIGDYVWVLTNGAVSEIRIGFADDAIDSAEKLTALLNSLPEAYAMYCLAEPAESPIPPETIAAFRKLCMNYPGYYNHQQRQLRDGSRLYRRYQGVYDGKICRDQRSYCIEIGGGETMVFNLHDFVMKTLKGMSEQYSEFQVREYALNWYSRGILKDEDMVEIENWYPSAAGEEIPIM